MRDSLGSTRGAMRISVLPLLAAIACRQPQTDQSATPTISTAGTYEAAFELSSFKPCGSKEVWWISFDTLTNLGRTVLPRLAMLDGKPDSMLGHAITFARFRGDMTPLGRYGHLGSYRRNFHVIEVQELRLRGPVDCKPQ